ncbi:MULTISPECIES: DUF5701 family protein [Streptomyces]|uniref:Uncharacterized protein n=1 Tax=Streptomyces koelreuteriae TaxID=2838015 RepID=A0ABX8G1A3_9ACTN|nr:MULTISPECIES: DUF5701 family protein [Streptomyces]QWB27295.1 hypothetical protein KJK29_34450 [Streptomyces koelreuteriae]UUA10380.1 DUF5701 family protein [Streptomyces koelreuteriae]UUA17987.1 DUF5701 family protein [Streptomyces sp. CRCS-T-1]
MPETTPGTTAVLPVLPALSAQAERLIETGVHEIAGLSAAEIRTYAADAEASVGSEGALLAVHPDRAPASALAPLLRREGKPGFVVVDMSDVDEFAPTGVELPDAPLYVLTGLDRGDHMSNWSPDEALPALTEQDRTPLLLAEGIHWVLQQPAALDRNLCFMTIGSRLRKPNGTFDARTPAIWISNGTGRDGRERREAPKVGWCWWNNRHTWLGFGSTTGRKP